MMRRTFGIFLLAVAVLLAVPPTTRAAGTGSQAVSTSLTLSANVSAVVFGETAMLRGRLVAADGSGVASRPVVIVARPAAGTSFASPATVTTDRTGAFTLAFLPARSATYRAEFAGDAEGLPAATSGEVRIAVASRVTLRVPAIMWIGETATLRGAVAPERPAGSRVAVQRRLGGVWRTVATALTDESSGFAALWTPSRSGRPLLRAVVEADVACLGGRSPVASGRVRDPNPHRVPRTLRRIVVIDHAAYRLYYYERGHLVRDFPCVLGKRATPTPLGKGFRIRRKRMDPGGANGARYLGYLGAIGIHGTDQPRLLSLFPRAFSHGCARLYDRHVIWLYDRVPRGTRVWNVRGARKLRVSVNRPPPVRSGSRVTMLVRVRDQFGAPIDGARVSFAWKVAGEPLATKHAVSRRGRAVSSRRPTCDRGSRTASVRVTVRWGAQVRSVPRVFRVSAR